jgi:hypothetical protein
MMVILQLRWRDLELVLGEGRQVSKVVKGRDGRRGERRRRIEGTGKKDGSEGENFSDGRRGEREEKIQQKTGRSFLGEARGEKITQKNRGNAGIANTAFQG